MTTYVVAARSQNTNSFGLRGYIFVDINGNACEAASGHFEHYEGDRVEVQSGDPETAFANAGYEIPHNRPKAPPPVIKQIWKVMPKAKAKCSHCYHEVLAENVVDGLCPTCQPHEVDPNAFDIVGFMMAWENEDMTEKQVVEGFQHLLDQNLAHTLQGCYGRTAAALIEQGLCKDTHGVFTGAGV